MIRPLVSEDVHAVLCLEQALFDNALSETAVRRELDAGWGLVLCENEVVLAYALLRPDAEVLDLTRLAVAPNAQRHGYGQQLLRYILDEPKPIVLTVLKHNRRALQLYLKHGFRIVGHFSPECAWVLRREPGPWDGPWPNSCSSPRTHRTA